MYKTRCWIPGKRVQNINDNNLKFFHLLPKKASEHVLFAKSQQHAKSHLFISIAKRFKKRLRAREQCHVEYNKTIAPKKEFSFKLMR